MKTILEEMQRAAPFSTVLVLLRITEASNDSTRMEIWKEFPGVGTILFLVKPSVVWFAPVCGAGDCPVKRCYSSPTGLAGKKPWPSGHIWHSNWNRLCHGD